MKVLQINIVFRQGSTGKIIADLHDYYNKSGRIESYVIYGSGQTIKEKNVFKISNPLLSKLNAIYTRLTGYMYKGSFLATQQIIRILENVNPDVVHIHCINGHMVNIYRLVEYLKKNNYPLVITNHAEFLYTGSYTHVPDNSTQWITGKKENYPLAKKLSNSWLFDKTFQSVQKFKRVFQNYSNLIVTSVSPWVTYNSKKSFVFNDFDHDTVLNGIDTSIFFYRNESSYLKKEKEYKYILHVTSGFNNPLKGTNYLLEIVDRYKDEKVKFVFVGTNGNELLPENCINLGKIYDQNNLAEIYSSVDLTILTSKKETYSMVTAESLSCGTPVVGFKAGGPESIALSEYSEFVDFGDINALSEVVKKWLAFKNDKKDISVKGIEEYSADKMANKYIEIYMKVSVKGKNI